MNLKFLLLLPLFLSFRAIAQSNNNISVFYGIATNTVDMHGAIGDFGYKRKTGTVYGAAYTRYFTKVFSLETGLQLSNDKVEQQYIVPARGEITADGKINLISVPVYAKFTFFKYL